MRRALIYILLFIITISGCKNKSTTKSDKALDCTREWFNAWKLVSEEVFQLKEQSPIRFVFFDSTYVYTTSPLTGKGGEIIDGPQLFNEKQVWYKKAHKGSLLLPDSSRTDVKFMIFTSQANEKAIKAFFVMPLLSFWVKENENGHGISLEKFTAGVFAHEFSHSQQLGSFRKFDKYIETYLNKYGDENFGDEMIQEMFSKDTIIQRLYNKELEAFKKAGTITNETERKAQVNVALDVFDSKHKFISDKEKKDLKMMDDIWLTMEGLGQYAMYSYLINPKGANLSLDKSFETLETKSWVQNEGFALFYLLSKYEKPEFWAKDFFGSDMKTIIAVLKNKTK